MHFFDFAGRGHMPLGDILAPMSIEDLERRGRQRVALTWGTVLYLAIVALFVLF